MADDKLVSVQPEMLRYADTVDLETLEYDDLVEIGRGIAEVKTYSSWLLGKLGNATLNKYGDLTQYAKDINQDYGTIQQYVNAYRKYTKEDPKFSPDKYFGQIPWGMIQLVATKSDKPAKLLDELVDKGIRTQDRAYRVLKEEETGIKIPTKPKLRLKWSEESGKWRIEIRPEEFDLIDWGNVKKQLMSYLKSLM